ncbi:hypothetical protein AGABI1DRAFT_124796 [Agaricus bisporus var. burnettii JB137-S8]|uniref:Uncharacterized protein n=1 Tax=Agaricus bisporus var. burnettii (strain JB137-S8 / ATCC MYA-4627 / FGSC 10392) TaxID=597362 RepID=K5W659_AGABU|nr:uncharacterized protein AGABI1DRAFT_124796 [Agaricus bisporus var. burnettii JB137-S8]EKM82314.1 hypothetical protein AGABI1DRAFT_124796 [Agaricus bisporus var. burnettii JB137-S8]
MDPPEILQPPTDGHKIWHSVLNNSISLADYLERVDIHYSLPGVICGPDDWFVSRVEAYKRDDGVRHELLLVKAKRTPRLPGNASALKDDQDNDLKDACLVIERCVENNEAARGKSASGGNTESLRDEEDYSKGRDGSSASLSDSLSRGSNTMVKWVWGGRTARDTARFIRSKELALKGCDQLGYMDFPVPPRLSADDDFRAALDALENPPAEPSPQVARFVSLPTLISLASFISGKYPTYTPTDTNCYWYCAMIIHILRRYAWVDFTILTKKDSVVIGPQDPRSIINSKVRAAKSVMGSCFFLTITGVPADGKVIKDAEEWRLKDTMRTEQLRDVRYTKLAKMREVEDGMEQERSKRKEAEDAIAEEKMKRLGETKRRLKEKEKRAEETKKRIHEGKKKREAMKRADIEKKRADIEEKRADIEKKRADDTTRELAERDRQLADMRRELEALKTSQ